MGLTTRDGSPDPVGIISLCCIIGTTLYDDLKINQDEIKLDNLCKDFLILRDSGDVSAMLSYLNELYSLLGQKLPAQIEWAATNADLLREVLSSLAQDFEEYLAEDGLV